MHIEHSEQCPAYQMNSTKVGPQNDYNYNVIFFFSKAHQQASWKTKLTLDCGYQIFSQPDFNLLKSPSIFSRYGSHLHPPFFKPTLSFLFPQLSLTEFFSLYLFLFRAYYFSKAQTRSSFLHKPFAPIQVSTQRQAHRARHQEFYFCGRAVITLLSSM